MVLQQLLYPELPALAPRRLSLVYADIFHRLDHYAHLVRVSRCFRHIMNLLVLAHEDHCHGVVFHLAGGEWS